MKAGGDHTKKTKGKIEPLSTVVLSKHQLIYSVGGLLLGLVALVGGVILFIFGVVGSTSWAAEILGAESNVTDAGPGVILFIVGMFIVLITRYKAQIHHK